MKTTYLKRVMKMVSIENGLNIGLASKARRAKLGFFGEVLAMKYLESLGHSVAYMGASAVGYDLLASGLRIEVKTAQVNKRGKYQVSLSKVGHSDIKKSDVLIVLCVGYAGKVTPLIIPTHAIADNRQLTVSSTFKGKLAQYVGNLQLIRQTSN